MSTSTRVPATKTVRGHGFEIQVSGYRLERDLGPYPAVTVDLAGRRTPGSAYKARSTARRKAANENEWTQAVGLDSRVLVEEHVFEGRTYFVTVWVRPDEHGNYFAEEGCDRCPCGNKYWEKDRCIDCGTHVSTITQEA